MKRAIGWILIVIVFIASLVAFAQLKWNVSIIPIEDIPLFSALVGGWFGLALGWITHEGITRK